MQLIIFLLLISIIQIFSIIQPSIEIFSQGQDNTDTYEDLYTKQYDQKDLTKMTIQNYYLKEIIKEYHYHPIINQFSFLSYPC